MTVSVKQAIQQSCIKNLLAAQRRIADDGSVWQLIALTRYLLRLSEKLGDQFVELSPPSEE